MVFSLWTDYLHDAIIIHVADCGLTQLHYYGKGSFYNNESY
jgi:hypothetical protein